MAANKNPQNHLISALQLADQQQTKKQYQEAIETLVGALDKTEESAALHTNKEAHTQAHTTARCHQHLARLFRLRGVVNKARWHGRQAAAAFAACHLPAETAAVQMELGDLELASRKHKTALAWFHQAAAGYEEADLPALAGLASMGACQAQSEIRPLTPELSQQVAEVRFTAIHAVESYGDHQQRLAAQQRAESIARKLGETQAVAWHMEQQIHLLAAENEALRVAMSSRELSPEAPNNAVKSKPNAAADMLHDFMEKAAHDMKEPLRMISSFSGLLERRYSEEIGTEGQEYLDIVTDAGQRMTSLMEKLVQYAHWGIAAPGSTSIALDDALLLALQPYREQQAAGKLELTHDYLGDMPGEPSHWEALFAELLANAVRFNTGETVRVHLARDTQPDMIWLRFSDNGIGIEAADREAVFTLFRRLHPRTSYAGSGIGLAIVSRIVALYGGQVRAEEAPDGGTCIVIGIPQRNKSAN